MESRGTESVETRKFKDAVLVEIFKAYEETGAVFQKTTDPETRQTMQDLKRCYDLSLQHLSPLGLPAEKRWEELGARIAD